jgi:cell division FtsZ-interacting protein ZapD
MTPKNKGIIKSMPDLHTIDRIEIRSLLKNARRQGQKLSALIDAYRDDQSGFDADYAQKLESCARELIQQHDKMEPLMKRLRERMKPFIQKT